MLLRPLSAAFLCLLAACASFPADSYGVGVAGRPSVKAATLLAHPELYSGRPVIVEGTITKVCPTKGCWMTVREGERELRVTFKDHAFFMPLDCAGRTAHIEGVFAIVDTSVAAAREKLVAAGKTEEAAKLTEPVRTLSLVATGVKLLPR